MVLLARQGQCSWMHKYIRRENMTSLIYVALVGLAAAGERIFFKLAIDQMEPFRTFLALLVVLFFVVGSGLVVAYQCVCTNEMNSSMRQFPRRSILTIALLDTLQLVLMVSSGASVPPVLSTLSMQATIPLFILLSGIIFSPRKAYTQEHWKGACVILFGIGITIWPTAYAAFRNHQRDIGINTLAYCFCCLPAAFSQLVKERAIARCAGPTNFIFMNFVLGLYQFAVLLILSPLTYRLQGVGMGLSSYNKTDLGTAVSDLCTCLFTGRHIDADKYPVAPECHSALLAVIGYILCTILVFFAVNGLLDCSSQRTLYRTLDASLALSFLALAYYSANAWGWLSPALNLFDFVGLLAVLIGLEICHESPDTEDLYLNGLADDAASDCIE